MINRYSSYVNINTKLYGISATNYKVAVVQVYIDPSPNSNSLGLPTKLVNILFGQGGPMNHDIVMSEKDLAKRLEDNDMVRE
jgi:hypothetical protein